MQRKETCLGEQEVYSRSRTRDEEWRLNRLRERGRTVARYALGRHNLCIKIEPAFCIQKSRRQPLHEYGNYSGGSFTWIFKVD